MADKKLNEVTKVTDMAYVPVIMADGSIGQIAKADLASVVAGVIGTATNSKNGLMPSSQFLVRDTISADVQITNFTQIKDGITFFFGAGTSYFPQSNGVVFKMSGYNSALLICCNQNADSIYIRMVREGKDSGWKAI